MDNFERILKRLGQIERRIIELDKRVAHVQLVVDLDHGMDVAGQQTITPVDDTLHLPGSGRLGGSEGGTRLSDDALAALAALDDSE